MKYTVVLISVLLTIGLIGCASTGFLMAKPKVTLYQETYPPKRADAKIDIFNTAKPDRDYKEIGQITCGDTKDSWNLEQILIKAREIGADAIIIIGRSGSHGVSIGNSGYVIAEDYGMTAIAIKFK